jgi:DNA-binding transcriptional regulator of glucitol operon
MPEDEFIGLRAGVLDNQTILDKAPMMEVYVERRMKWLKPIEGALQLDAQYAVMQYEQSAIHVSEKRAPN